LLTDGQAEIRLSPPRRIAGASCPWQDALFQVIIFHEHQFEASVSNLFFFAYLAWVITNVFQQSGIGLCES